MLKSKVLPFVALILRRVAYKVIASVPAILLQKGFFYCIVISGLGDVYDQTLF